MKTIEDLTIIIDDNIQNIQDDLSIALVGKKFADKYETLWRAHEEAVIGVIPDTIKKYAEFLSDRDFGEKDAENQENHENQNEETNPEDDTAQFVEAIKTPKTKAKAKKQKKDKGKNRLADSEIRVNGQAVLLSIKSAKSGETPGNDLGTFNSFERKKKLYAAAYEIWIFYSNKDNSKVVTQVYFNRSFFFVGRHQKAEGVNYREKDGNMRPKSWKCFVESKSEWQSYEDFEHAFDISQKYRANRVALKHLPFMTDEKRFDLLQRLIIEFHFPDELRLEFYDKLKNRCILANDNADKIKIYEDLMQEYEPLLNEYGVPSDFSVCKLLEDCFLSRINKRKPIEIIKTK